MIQYFSKGFDGGLICGGKPGNGNGGGPPDDPGSSQSLDERNNS